MKIKKEVADILTIPISYTYGEILPFSMDKIFRYIIPNSTDIFIDLGSGRGQIAAYVATNYPFAKVYGVEIVPAYHQLALKLQQTLQNDKLIFIEGDLFEQGLMDATIALLCATCFTEAMLYRIAALLNQAPQIRTLISLRAMPNLFRLRFKRALKIQCSWDSTLCYLYQQ